MIKQSAIAFLLLFLLAGAKINGGPLPLAEYYPPGVTLGMPVDQLSVLRPGAEISPVALLPGSDRVHPGSYSCIEYAPPFTYLTYIIREGQVEGVIRSEPVSPDGSPSAFDPAAINESLRRELVLVNGEHIARASASLQHFPVRAELWQDERTEYRVYFVSTSEETTLIVFNPAALSGEDFFVAADRIPELEAEAGRIRSLTGADSEEKIMLADRPWEAAESFSFERTALIAFGAVTGLAVAGIFIGWIRLRRTTK